MIGMKIGIIGSMQFVDKSEIIAVKPIIIYGDLNKIK
jgi:hypothetical protein